MKQPMVMAHSLTQLAKKLGISTTYRDAFQKQRKPSIETITALIQCFGFKIEREADAIEVLKYLRHESAQTCLEPVTVIWDHQTNIPITINKHFRQDSANATLIFEDQTSREWKIDLANLPLTKQSKGFTKFIDLPDNIPFGYHELHIEVGNQHHVTFLIHAKTKVYSHAEDKTFGFFAPIYALPNQQSFGCGDLGDFNQLLDWTIDLGGRLIATLPLHAAFLVDHFEPSPYSPVSRLFWNELYLDLNSIHEFQHEMLSDSKSGKESEYVNYLYAMAVKRNVLRKMVMHCLDNNNRLEQFTKFVKNHPYLIDYARFRAIDEKNQTAYPFWSTQNFDQDALNYHLYVQWQMNLQLQQLAVKAKQKNAMLYFDMPLGVNPIGFDTYQFKSSFALAAQLGAAPDPGFPQGQKWGIPPLHPRTIRSNRYHYFIQTLRAIMPFVDLLRIDHVMGLHRLFWIPNQHNSGSFIRYFADEFYAILSIESHRHQVSLVGENLGTVPKIVNQRMTQHGLKKMFVLQYELDSKHKLSRHKIPVDAVASLNTHDMSTFASYLQGSDISERIYYHLTDPAEQKPQQTARKKALENLQVVLKIKSEPLSLRIWLEVALLFLAQSNAQFLLVNLEDLWLETKAQNLPGTNQANNWRHRIPFQLPDILQKDDVHSLIKQIASLRPSKISSANKADFPIYPYSTLSADDIFWFNEGSHFRLYQFLGAHPIHAYGQDGVYFAVWAPNAKSVSVISDFNQWNKTSHFLQPHANSGIWEGFIANVKPGFLYKFHIESHYHHFTVDKADPFGVYHEVPPKTASIVWDLSYQWHDEDWLKNRGKNQNLKSPITIYEIHLGSWRRLVEENNRFLTYRELAPYLAFYVKEMGYSHVEFLPIMEHPYYESWGYQTTGYFAPTSRYGTPQDFMYLIDYLHQHQIGVIIDWVPSHFPNDEHGLAYFDGTHLFEHADPRQGFHPDWKSAIFNYSRNEIWSFLISSALFWLDKYHIDGIRVDAVASMLYLDYSRKPGEWIPNAFGGRENLSAVNFLRRFNEVVYANYPDVQTIAEESTAWGNVSKPIYMGGLGFGFKWDMGWMHDTLHYLSQDPIYRKYYHNEMSFRMIYAFTENFVLPLSHDEVVHGKGSLLAKMPGKDFDKFANVRLLLGYMYTQPGKKLLFMGNDFGQWREWQHNESLDWHLLNDALHQGLQNWVKKLNELYQHELALHELDHDPAGFAWIDCHDAEQSIFSFIRKSSNNDCILIVVNGTPVLRKPYRVGIPYPGHWQELANSDEKIFGGANNLNDIAFAETIPAHHQAFSLSLTLPPLSIIMLRWIKL